MGTVSVEITVCNAKAIAVLNQKKSFDFTPLLETVALDFLRQCSEEQRELVHFIDFDSDVGYMLIILEDQQELSEEQRSWIQRNDLVSTADQHKRVGQSSWRVRVNLRINTNFRDRIDKRLQSEQAAIA